MNMLKIIQPIKPIHKISYRSWRLMIEKIIERYQLKSIHEIWPNFHVYLHGGVFMKPYLPRINIYQFTRYIFLKKGNIFSINFKYQESIVQIRGSIKAAQCLLFEDDFKKITRGEGLISLFFDRWNFCTTHWHQVIFFKKTLSFQ